MIVPVYNTPPLLLTRCLESIIAQTHQRLEVIVVDDGSSEYDPSTNEVMVSDQRITLIRQQNLGVSVARNTGIEAATGRYLAFVDADDWVTKDFVSEAVDLLEATSADAVFGGIQVIGENSVSRWRFRATGTLEPVFLGPMELAVAQSETLSASPSTKADTGITTITNVVAGLFRGETLKEVTFPTGVAHSEDRIFLVRYFAQVDKVAVCPRHWYNYDQSTSSATRDITLQSAEKIPATILEMCAIGGFSSGSSGISHTARFKQAAAKSAFNYLKVFVGVASTRAIPSRSKQLVRDVLMTGGLDSALRYLNVNSVPDRVFLWAARSGLLCVLQILGRIWWRSAQKNSESVRGSSPQQIDQGGRKPVAEFRSNSEDYGSSPEIALIVHYSDSNYGNHLVNYAAGWALRKLGYKVQLVYFQKNRRYGVFSSLIKLPLKLARLGISGIIERLRERRWLKKEMVSNPPVNIARIERFREFSERFLRPKAHDPLLRHDLTERFSMFAIGSDQIWNYDYELGPWNFADFVAGERVTTISPSVGHDSIPLEWRRFYRKYISRLGVVSTRELDWSRSLINVDPVLLIDPTLALSRNDWEAIASQTILAKNEVLVYVLGALSAEQEQYISEIERLNQIDLLLLNGVEQGPQWETNASDFIGMIANASAVITDSYHGAVFAFIFDKPLTIIPRQGFASSMNSRIRTLADQLHLGDRLISELTPELALSHDYGRGYVALEGLQEEYWRYLKSSLCKVDLERGDGLV